MIVNAPNLQFFFTGLLLNMRAAYSTAPTYYDKLCTTIPSGTEQNLYGWIGKIDKMREWVGARQVHSPAPQTYTLVNQPYELTLSIDKFKLQDDQQGIYAPLATDLGMQAKKWPDYQLRDLLQGLGTQIGSRLLGLDGLNHWSTVHPIDIYDSTKGTYANDFKAGGVVVNGVTVGGALTPNGFSTVYQEMVSRKGEDNEALAVTPNLVAVPPQLAITANTIAKAAFFSPPALGGLTGQVGNMQNMLQGMCDVLVVPEWAGDPTTWYMFDTTKAVKPFIFQQRQAPNFVTRINEQDPIVFDTHTYLYGTDARGALGFSHAFLSSRSGP